MTNDLAVFRRTPAGTMTSTLADANSGGEIVTGIDKLLQKVVMLLMTPRGSVPYQPKEGTTFVEQLRSGQASTESDVIAGFAMASTVIASTLRGEKSISDDPEEILSGLKLTRIAVQQGAITLDIAIKNQAGVVAQRAITLPFTL